MAEIGKRLARRALNGFNDLESDHPDTPNRTAFAAPWASPPGALKSAERSVFPLHRLDVHPSPVPPGRLGPPLAAEPSPCRLNCLQGHLFNDNYSSPSGKTNRRRTVIWGDQIAGPESLNQKSLGRPIFYRRMTRDSLAQVRIGDVCREIGSKEFQEEIERLPTEHLRLVFRTKRPTWIAPQERASYYELVEALHQVESLQLFYH